MTRRLGAARSLAALLLVTGSLHFVVPAPFDAIVPGFLGAPRLWTYASGVAELACAAGLLVPRTRRAAGWACAALFVAVFPANLQMAVDALRGDGSVLVSLLRLPLQVPLVVCAVYVARTPADPADGTARPGRQPNRSARW